MRRIPDSLGSLGIAISEAVEDAAMRDDTHYALGSVLNHVVLHQSIIGLEAKKQFEKIDDYPDMVIGCNGGGSNFSGCAFPFVHDRIKNGTNTEFIAVEPAACPQADQRPVYVRLRRYRKDGADCDDVHAGARFYTSRHS